VLDPGASRSAVTVSVGGRGRVPFACGGFRRRFARGFFVLGAESAAYHERHRRHPAAIFVYE
jgi:hypothetical protein